MLMSGENDFDADLDAMLNGTEVDTTNPQPQAQPTQPAVEKLKYGGREWDDHKALGKAYEGALKEMTRATQEAKRLKPYGDFDAYLSKHPELRNEFNILWNAKVQEYQKRLEAGQAPATAQRATGITPEYAERIERIEAHFEDQKLREEIGTLKSKFGLDKGGVDNVLNKAIELSEKGVELPLEDVYKIIAFEEKKLEAKKEGEKQALNNLNAKKKANVGGSSLPSANPSAKGISEMSGSEYNKALEDRLNQLGYSG